MRVAFLTPRDPTGLGGVERFTTSLAIGLEASGATTAIFWPATRRVSFALTLAGADEWVGGRRAGARLEESGFQPDVVIGNGTFASGIPRGVRGVAVHHGIYAALAEASRAGMSWREYARLRYLKAQWEVRAGKGCTRVAVSQSTLEDLRRYHGMESALVIENGVDTKHFSPRDRREARARFGFLESCRYVLYAGRLESRKGIDVLSGLARRLEHGQHLLIASEQHLEGPQTIHLGPISYDDMPWLLSAVDLFVLPTRYEGWSMALLEAMACETPFVATLVGGARDLERAPQLSAALLPTPAAEAFCGRVKSLLADPDGARRLGRAARAYVKEYHEFDHWTARWLVLLQSLVASVRR